MASPLHNDGYKALVEYLAEMRTSAGITQKLLGENLERPQSYVSKVERCERRIDMIEFTAWTRAIGIDPCYAYEVILGRIDANREALLKVDWVFSLVTMQFLRQLMGNIRGQVEHGVRDPDEIAIDYDHQLGAIHVFPLGNGRHEA